MSAPPTSSFFNLGQLLGDKYAWVFEKMYQEKCDFRVAIPVIVQSFDEDAQTVDVQVAIQEDMKQNGVPTPTNIAPLLNLPVGPLRAGGFAITLPFTAGDEGIALFNDMCIDSWWQSGGTMNRQLERRRHHISDGVFLPVCWSQPRKFTNYSTEALEIRSDDGTVKITVSESGITITPDNGTTIYQIQAGAITLTATTVTVNGNLTVNGNISNSGTLDGKNFLTHVHSGVTIGGGDSGPPV
jgi:hypothetical protein